MGDLRTKLVVDLTGNLAGQAQKYTNGLVNMGQRGSRAMQVLGRSVREASRGLDRIGNRYTAILTGAVGIGSIKMVGDLSQRLTYLGITANASSEDIDKLYASILAVAQAKDIRVDPSGLLGAVEVIVEKLGDMDLARDNLRNIGLAMRATGADGKEVGDMIGNFKEKFALSTNAEIFKALDLLVNQGKAGAFTLKDMVTQGNRVTAAYGSMGGRGIEGVRQMGAVLQVFRKSSGSAEETSTAFKNVFNDLMEKSDKLDKYMKKKNFIWDPAELKKGRKQIKPIADLLFEIIKAAKGDPQKLGKIFGMQSMDGLKAAINEYNKTGKNPFTEFMNVPFDGKALLSDSARAAGEFNAALQNLHTSWQKFALENLSGPVTKLADALNSMDEATVQRWMNMAKNIAMVGAGLIAINKIGRAVFWTRVLFGRGAGPGAGVPGVQGLGTLPLAGGGTIAVGAIIAGALTVGGVAAGQYLGKKVGEWQAGQYSTEKLQQMISESKVMGIGGAGADNVKIMEAELARRQAETAEAFRKLDANDAQTVAELRRLNVEFDKKIQVRIKVDSEGRPKVTGLQNPNRNVAVDVDAGWMMATE